MAELFADTEKVIINLTKLIKQQTVFSGKNKLIHLQHWFQMTAKKTRKVTFSIPLLANEKTNKYIIHHRKNTGIDIRIDQPSLAKQHN